LFKRFFGRRKFRRFPDSFTLTKTNKLGTLCHWVRQQSGLGEAVLVLSHFQSSFLDNQSALQDAGIDFEIVAESVDESRLARRLRETASDGGPAILLTMTQMLQSAAPATSAKPAYRTPSSPSTGTDSGAVPLSVIVTERYPLTTRDQALEQFLEQCPMPVALGYLISFDDPILVHLLGNRFVDLLKQLGLGDHDLVSSAMTHRGLTRKLQRATSRIRQERPAESPEQWIEWNLESA
jgi:hypothetical protein